ARFGWDRAAAALAAVYRTAGRPREDGAA
ncbi:MAG: hypothetical protein JWN46_2657, partial [Acidimicrobiales bacterium]|nr:hypothetical protein [Acidimicrobiales bacterium]